MSTTVADTTASPLLGSTNSDIHRSLGRDHIVDLERPACSRPEPLAIVFELIWCTIIVSVAIFVLAVWSKGETTEAPLRVWIVGFVVLRLLRMVCVCVDYSSRRQLWEATTLDPNNIRQTSLGRISKCLHTVNMVLNVVWWIVGLYWMFSGGKALANDAPKLFWSAVIFLALDLFVLVIFAFVSCFLCVTGYCFLRFFMPFLSTERQQNGAARFTWNFSSRLGSIQESPDGSMSYRDTDTDTDTPTYHAISAKNAV